ncbi:hypothetical protein H6F74_18440 [Trichocoleus sp. FACHB-90]|uniref:hypothetical protein n=1 Tax=Cyanophyceae TaxID=3028117 RepID=UPI00168261EB|nr:hypothetical protein [Trichocoleus sp. FACHB-90]MBD1928210.1 hypothetical protein [Trichocoleus sp. FACHB-90]
MLYQVLQINKLFTGLILAIAGIVVVASGNKPVQARPAEIFTPHLQEIQSNLPLGLVMRLPSQIQLSGFPDIDFSKLIVRVFPSETPAGLTVSLFTCISGPQPCLLGSFSVARNTSPNAIRDLEKHKATGDRITLKPNIKGYLLEGSKQKPAYEFSSVMWQQDNLIYRVSLPQTERLSMLFMAYSMANEAPLRRVVSPPIIGR